MKLPELTIQLPEWVAEYVDQSSQVFSDIEDRMDFVIELSRKNIEHQTGGPFGAAVFDAAGRLIAPGANMVIPSNCSILHAEMVAIALTQKVLGRFDISDGGKFDFALFATTEPCAMCFGAIPWSGVRRLVCGARKEDAQAIGFDEGPRIENWTDALADRGINVIRDVRREKAAAVLNDYVKYGGRIYNPDKKPGKKT
ncbi:MAG: nucleoside deaminase [Desulfobacteraceae bacterium]|nr:nucleoside deaminase [Desulfobacteraceae bacterium]MBC2755604.1 nucleoside deaminase [Desulfobacteraceae bacterium]